MSAAALLIAKAYEYELKGAHEAELAEHEGVPGLMPTVWATVAVTLREVAAALEDAA